MYEADAVCRESLRRCNKDPKFMDIFYDKFIASSEKVAHKFAEVDLEKQKKALQLSLRMLIMSGRGDDTADMYLRHIAERHSRRDLDIEPELYALWLEALVATVRQVDLEFTSEVERAWREILQHGIDYLISEY